MYHHYCTSGHFTLTMLWSANETDCHSQCVPDRENVAFLTFQRKACLLLISVIWRKNTIHPEYTQLWGSQLIDHTVCVHTCWVPTLWQSSGCTTRSIPGGPPLPKMSLHWWHLSLHTADGDRPSRPWGCDGTRRAPPPFLLLIKEERRILRDMCSGIWGVDNSCSCQILYQQTLCLSCDESFMSM